MCLPKLYLHMQSPDCATAEVRLVLSWGPFGDWYGFVWSSPVLQHGRFPRHWLVRWLDRQGIYPEY
jgi:hypothetical protein